MTQGKTIIILEDEEVLGSIYKKKLEEASFLVYWKKTVEDVEVLMKNLNFDIILIDHGIKGHKKSGIDLIPLVRAISKNAKIIMLSNYSEPELREKCLKNGADDFLLKINMPPKKLVEYLS